MRINVTESLLVPPAFLSPAAADRWRREAWAALASGTLTAESYMTFAAYCRAGGLIDAAMSFVGDHGFLFPALDGRPCTWPDLHLLEAVTRYREQVGEMLGYPAPDNDHMEMDA